MARVKSNSSSRTKYSSNLFFVVFGQMVKRLGHCLVLRRDHKTVYVAFLLREREKNVNVILQ